MITSLPLPPAEEMAAFFRNERSVSSAAAKPPQDEHAKQAVATVISFGGLIYLLQSGS